MNPLYQKSEWCQAGTIEHFEKIARFHGNRHQIWKIEKVWYLRK